MSWGLKRRQFLGGLAGGFGVASLPIFAIGAGRQLIVATTVDLSGVESANGTGLVAGAKACFKAINAKGGINGSAVELVVKDDRFDPQIAGSNALAFANDTAVLALLNPLGTGQTASVIKAVPNVAIVGPSTGTVSLRKAGARNTFFVRANYDQELNKLVQTAATVGMSSIGLVYPNDSFGLSFLGPFKEAVARFGLSRSIVASTPSTISPEVAPAAEKIAEGNPQFVIVALSGRGPMFVKALRAKGCAAALYGLSIMYGPRNTEELGPYARGIGFSITVPPPNATKFEVVRRFQADMNASGLNDHSSKAVEGYMNALVLAEGLRRAGPSPTRESVLAALGGIDALDLGGVRISYAGGRREGGSYVDVGVLSENGRMLV